MMRQKEISWHGWPWVVVTALIGWIFFSLGAYYVAQKPLDMATLSAIGDQQSAWQGFSLSGVALGRSWLDVLAVTWILLTVWGVGLWLWRWLGITDADWGETAVFAFGLGFGAVGLLILLVGLVGWRQRPFLLLLTLGLTLLGLPVLIPFLRRAQFPSRPSLPITLYLLIATGLAFTIALLPPTSWDSLSYHLRGPWLYLQAGRIYPDIDVFSLNNPFLLEMLFLLTMAIRSDSAAQLVHFSFVFLLAGLVYIMAVKSLKLQTGWTAVLLLFTTPMTLRLASIAYNDLALVCTVLASLYSYLRWRENPQTRWLLMSGIFSGLAMSLKYTSFVTPLVIGGLLVWQHWRQPRQLLHLLLLFALPALFVALPWYVKNWAFTGNPVYPFVWNGRFWDDFRTLAHRNPGSGIGWNLLAILRIPYTLTQGTADASGDGQTGPLFLAFLPLLLFYTLFRLRQHPPLAFRILLLFALIHYLVWVLGVIDSAPLWQGRLMLPALVALCPALAWSLADLRRFDHPQFSLYRFLNLVLAMVILFELVTQVGQWLRQNPLAYVAGSQSRPAYLEQNLGYLYLASQAMNDTLPADAVVQFLWEPRTYYCHLDCRGDHILDKYTHLEYLYGSADAIAQALAAEGVTHLFIFDQGRDYLAATAAPAVVPVNAAEYDRFMAQHIHVQHRWGTAYTLVELIP